MRCAIYARYSSDLQRESSIEDQIRKCREFADRQEWIVLEGYVRSDQAISGAALPGRDALQSLVEDARRKPRPFDCLLVEDTSRLARNMGDGLKLLDILQYQGVSVISITQGIDSRQKSARPLMALHGMIDEQFLVGLADKVHRGQEARVLKGLHPGGRCYGYRNIPIEDPSRPGKYGRPAVSGVRLEVKEEEGEVIRRIFQMYADGMSLAAVAKRLNAEGVPAPRPPKTRSLRAWCPSSIREMLRNERYRGVQVWNRTAKQRNPETGLKNSRPRLESEWVRAEAPEWRIVPEELWEAVRSRIALVQELFGRSRCGGIGRTAESRRYLFSGLLLCGCCGSHTVIVSGWGKRGYAKYGCLSHRYRGVCSNRLTIRQDRLEAQLLGALEARILTPQMLDYALKRFDEALQSRLRQIERHSSELSALEEESVKLQAQVQRIAIAIAEAGHSPSLLSHLAAIEAKLVHVDHRIAANKILPRAAATAGIRSFVLEKVMGLRGLLRGDVSRARAALMEHFRPLVLTPEDTPTGPLYAVTGGVDVPLSKERVMPVVARDGIDTPTVADSTQVTVLSSHQIC
ncbi:MAG TPA: recombinase family protein [Bryobacteraceae bacterium]|jgi:DNA invertase Pin-like site-specific DNA recombinase|nr:recombinase family protein [Bryobacteraceae bacterium]